MVELPQQFIERMTKTLGNDAEKFFLSYQNPAQKGIRVNTLKISVKDFLSLSPFSLEPVPWENSGFYITEEKPGKSPFHSAGLFYVQEPSAMCAVPLLDVKKGEKVLDLCSAPGGKGTQLAQKLQGEGVVFLNEINFDRAKILSQNVERMGIKNAVVTCASPKQLADVFVGYFDKILVDAPCSGEGMFKKEPNAIPEWSVENVHKCAERQREILEYAQKMLKTGGKMVYSTCTFAEAEDENQIENFLLNHKNFELLQEKKHYPHLERGEGHFAALLEKKASDEEEEWLKSIVPTLKDKKLLTAYNDFEKQFLNVKFENLHLIGSNLYSLPNDMPKIPIQTLRAGIHLGEFKGDRFEPSHSLAMCLKSNEAQFVETDDKTVNDYLSGNTFECSESVKGWALVTYRGYPLGWCKAVNGMAKNHLPKGLRI